MTRERFISQVKGCQGQLRRFLTSLCAGNSALADDIAQDALVRAYVSSGRFVGNFKGWLFRIAYNCFIDHLRRSPSGMADFDSAEVGHIAGGEPSDVSFRHEELQMALGRIPEKERAAIVLHYFEDLPIKEISAIMQIPSGTVKYHLSQGRTHLRQYLSR